MIIARFSCGIIGTETVREVEIDTDKIYQISPLNPRKKRHRGRLVKVLSCREKGCFRVKFLDTGRVGVVDGDDLIEFENKEAA
jgi:hypothetical protein